MINRAITSSQIRPPAGFAHADYTDVGGREAVQQHMGEAEAERLLRKPCAIVHVSLLMQHPLGLFATKHTRVVHTVHGRA